MLTGSKAGLKASQRDLAFFTVESQPEPPLSFEASLSRLESIVESMEGGDVPLADLLSRFEEGSRLLKTCEDHLKDAELKIELLKKRRDGVSACVPFEDESTGTPNDA